MFLLYLYIVFSSLVYCVVPAFLRYRVKHGREDPIRYREKLGEASQVRPQGDLVWFHAGGFAELKAVLPLIREYNEELPHVTCLVTTSSLNAFEVFKSANLRNAIHQYVPIDCPAIVKRFFAYWNPSANILTESSIFTNVIIQAKEYGPTYLVNAKLSAKTFKRWRYIRGTMRYLLSLYTVILPITNADANRFRFFTSSNLQYIGNLKNAAPPMPYKADLLRDLKQSIGNRRVLMYASIHKGEEEVGLHVHNKLSAVYKNLLTIIIPMHMEVVPDFCNVIKRHNLNFSLFSANKGKIAEDEDVYLVDAVGELGTFYRVAPFTFVGGSLVRKGGHNVLEPAKLGLAIITGPYTYNFTEIIKNFRQKEAINIVRDEKSLIAVIRRLMDDEVYLKKQQRNALESSDGQYTIMQRTLECISWNKCKIDQS